MITGQIAKVKPQILVTDDEDRNLRLMEAMLAPLGWDVVLARDGEEAIRKAHEAAPDVILLDIMMPKIDGFEVARRLKKDEETRMIPIVMVTALSEVKDRITALEAGADDFLAKPVDQVELRARVGSLLKVKAYNDHMRDYQQHLEAEVNRRTAELREALEKIQSASLDTIFRLAQAAEYKDEDTGAHIKRMSLYASEIAVSLGLNRDAVQSIRYASGMHDVGKIAIPDRILMKPGKLNPEEWEIMKQHTTFGAKILTGSDSEFIKMAEVIALTHHEKWDGSGYPSGLAGAAIPVSGRVVAIADVFDALTSRRPYKPPFSVQDSIDIIKRESGSHFDPKAVEAFLDAKGRIASIKQQFEDTRGAV